MSAIEWMTKLDAKTQQYTLGTGGQPEIDWMDVCGAIAALPSILQDYAFLLHSPSRSGLKTMHLVAILGAALASEIKATGIICRKQRLDDLCSGIASSAVYQSLYPNVCQTRTERMAAGGVVMDEGHYQKRWECYEYKILNHLEQWRYEIEWAISDYMHATKREVARV
jgi:hypothetical protein